MGVAVGVAVGFCRLDFFSLSSLFLAITSLHSGNIWAYSLEACLFWLRADDVAVSSHAINKPSVYPSAFSRTHLNVCPLKPPNCILYSNSNSVLSLMSPPLVFTVLTASFLTLI